jgi:hypothetical protein
MFWTGLLVAMGLGVSIGIVIGGMLSAAKRCDVKEPSNEMSMDHAGPEEIEEFDGLPPPVPKPLTYLDRYPHA